MTCFICGEQASVQHHIRYRPSETVNVCSQCHFQIHTTMEKSVFIWQRILHKRMLYGRPFLTHLFTRHEDDEWCAIVTNPNRGGGTNFWVSFLSEEEAIPFHTIGWPVGYLPLLPDNMFHDISGAVADGSYVLATIMAQDQNAQRDNHELEMWILNMKKEEFAYR